MTTITLPESLASRLRQQAALQHRSIEALAVDLLADALDTLVQTPSVADVVAQIRRTPPRAENIRPAQGSLADALRRIPSHPDVDLAQWDADWRMVENELRKMTQMDEERDAHG